MEQMRNKINRLRCVLCREGLLKSYNVYDVPVDEFGAEGAPVLYTTVKGFYYAKGSRLGSFALEIAGNLLKGGGKSLYLMTFDDPVTCKVGDLVETGGVFYRMNVIEPVYDLYHVIELALDSRFDPI
jgi:hypothetical protein